MLQPSSSLLLPSCTHLISQTKTNIAMRHPSFLLKATCLTMLIAMLLTSCREISFIDLEDEDSSSRTFTFSLFTSSESRATSVSDFQKIAILDIVNGTVRQTILQHASDPDFGMPQITLTNGSHTLRFFATDAPSIIMEGTILSQPLLGDTFVHSSEIDTKTAESSQRVVLSRAVARLCYTGESSATVSGLLSAFDLLAFQPTGNGKKVTLQKDEEAYTFIPASGTVTLDGSKEIPVRANSITTIDDDGTEIDPGDDMPQEDEILVFTNDTAQFYVAKKEITKVVLSSTPDPQTAFAAQIHPYRVPTRMEAVAIRHYDLPADYWSGSRCLCYDRPEDNVKIGSTQYGTGKYYTFTWTSSSTGSVTAAGEKTAYSIKPIRIVPLAPLAHQFAFDADFEWSTDTIAAHLPQ